MTTAIEGAGRSSAAQAMAATTQAGPGSATALSSDFETFLKMLTVQMENQDPLNPVDSADYAVQLATFSGVEQQVLTNDLLATLTERLGAGSLAEVAGWVGREARVAAPLRYDGAPVTVAPAVAEGADSASLLVRDASGAIVDSQPLAPGSGPLDWVPADPARVAVGDVLSFSVESRAGEEVIGTAPAQVYATVREVRMASGGPEIVLPGGSAVPASEVTALRAR